MNTQASLVNPSEIGYNRKGKRRITKMIVSMEWLLYKKKLKQLRFFGKRDDCGGWGSIIEVHEDKWWEKSE